MEPSFCPIDRATNMGLLAEPDVVKIRGSIPMLI